jgi:hypothetical protein
MTAVLADNRFAEPCEPNNCRDVMSRSRDIEALTYIVEIADFEEKMSRRMVSRRRITDQTCWQQIAGKTLGQCQRSLFDMKAPKTRAALWKQ